MKVGDGGPENCDTTLWGRIAPLSMKSPKITPECTAARKTGPSARGCHERGGGAASVRDSHKEGRETRCPDGKKAESAGLEVTLENGGNTRLSLVTEPGHAETPHSVGLQGEWCSRGGGSFNDDGGGDDAG